MPKDVMARLAHALGRRDEVPNVELAEALALRPDGAAVQVLVDHLADKNAAIRSDCIKVLYELGERKPAQIAPHVEVFLTLLAAKDNRLQWGAMTALSAIAMGQLQHEILARHVDRFVDAADQGSVITRDRAVLTLAALAANAKHSKRALPLLFDQVLRSPVNQLPMYAEATLPVIGKKDRARFVEILEVRMSEALPPAKRKRLENVLKKLAKQA